MKGDYFVICEEKLQEDRQMIIMNLEIDNFFAFKNFCINMSYPKKIVNSGIDGEFLKDRPNFRYKKINIIMGANATGKTSLGKMIMAIFNFIDKKEYDRITDFIPDKSKKASFTIDFVSDNKNILNRVSTTVMPVSKVGYSLDSIYTVVKSVPINVKDSYESCVKRFDNSNIEKGKNYIEELEKINGLSWMFTYPIDSYYGHDFKEICKDDKYIDVLTKTLKTLDPSIVKVERLEGLENTLVIRLKHDSVIIKEGKLLNGEILSSGTKESIDAAYMLASIISDEYGFYYCDEKFSYVHSDIEKAYLSIMIDKLKDNNQLFFTTHNMDILDLCLPKHSYIFLKKDINDEDNPIKCIYASDFLKRNTDSLRSAVENDLFSSAPSVETIFEVMNL